MMAFSIKGNLWDIDPRNPMAQWNIYAEGLTHEHVIVELSSFLNIFLQIGKRTGILYLDSLMDNFKTEQFIQKAIESKTRYIHDLFFSFTEMREDVKLLSNLYVYDSELELISMQFFPENVMENLRLISHPRTLYGQKLTTMPISVSLMIVPDRTAFQISIQLHYDIFFPFVVCNWEWTKKYDSGALNAPVITELDYSKYGFNNHRLSSLNGTKLNLLLVGLKEYIAANPRLVWDFEKTEHWIGYQSMLSDHGILIDYPSI